MPRACTLALLAAAFSAQPIAGQLRKVDPAKVGAASGCTPGDNSFEILLLVEQWPGTLEMNAQGFTMHGLWPSRTGANVANYPCQCTDQTFDLSQVQSILPQLNEWWPSDKGDNSVFWTHEFEKHGTCAEAIPALQNELKFFQGTLNLRSKLNTEGALTDASVTPSFSTTYALADMERAVSTATIFKCNASNFLTEVATCYDKSLNLVDCESDTYGGSNCQDGIHYIPATGWSPSAAPSPSHAPSPHSTGQCVHDEHGPPCTTDAECLKVKDCVRCASSGFCTDVPKEFELE